MLPESVKLRRGEYVRVRLLTVTDFLPLHKMYGLLSEENKKFFRPTFFKRIGLKWTVANFALLLSTVSPLKILLTRLYPRAITVPLLAISDKNDAVAFAYLNIKRRLTDGKYSAGFAICVRDDYQGKSLGSELTKLAIELARKEGISEISVWVALENYKAISLYKRFGFQVARLLKRTGSKGENYDYLKMSLHLS